MLFRHMTAGPRLGNEFTKPGTALSVFIVVIVSTKKKQIAISVKC
jgi:hypothetical protein